MHLLSQASKTSYSSSSAEYRGNTETLSTADINALKELGTSNIEAPLKAKKEADKKAAQELAFFKSQTKHKATFDAYSQVGLDPTAEISLFRIGSEIGDRVKAIDVRKAAMEASTDAYEKAALELAVFKATVEIDAWEEIEADVKATAVVDAAPTAEASVKAKAEDDAKK